MGEGYDTYLSLSLGKLCVTIGSYVVVALEWRGWWGKGMIHTCLCLLANFVSLSEAMWLWFLNGGDGGGRV